MKFYSVENKKLLSEEELKKKIEDSQVIYFGEKHNIPEVLQAQKWIIRTAGKGTLVLEMFNIEQQSLLDRYIEGELTQEQMKEEYEKGGEGFPLDHYLQLVDTSREVGSRVLAGFVPRPLAARVVREGIEVIDDYRLFPKSAYKQGHEEHLQRFSEMIPPMMKQRFSIDKFFAAQILKDSSMAHVISEELKRNPDQKIVAICGSGHSDYGFGIPERVEPKKESLIITTTYDLDVDPSIADIIFLIDENK